MRSLTFCDLSLLTMPRARSRNWGNGKKCQPINYIPNAFLICHDLHSFHSNSNWNHFLCPAFRILLIALCVWVYVCRSFFYFFHFVLHVPSKKVLNKFTGIFDGYKTQIITLWLIVCACIRFLVLISRIICSDRTKLYQAVYANGNFSRNVRISQMKKQK